MHMVLNQYRLTSALREVPKYGVISGSYFPAFGLNTERYFVYFHSPNMGKYGPETTPYLDTFQAVAVGIGSRSTNSL